MLTESKLDNSFSTAVFTLQGYAPILGPLLRNIFINDVFLFLLETEIVNYADDNTPYTINKDTIKLIQKLESDTANLNTWFRSNFANLMRINITYYSQGNITQL